MKRPHMIPDAKRVAMRSSTLWVNRLAFLALVVPNFAYKFFGIETGNPELWFWLGFVLYVAVEVARYVRQNSLQSPALVAVLATFLAMGWLPDWMRADVEVEVRPPPVEAQELSTQYTQKDFLDVAIPLIAKWEGLRLESYRDIVGVWTVCYGETKGVQPGDSYTKAECRNMLAREVLSYRGGWFRYLTPETINQRLHAPRDAAFTSLAYNVGVRRAGTSTATKRLNAGNIAGACEAATWYNKAGKRIVRGLVNRRTDEYQYCTRGLT